MQNNYLFLFLCFIFFACDTQLSKQSGAIVGKWKIYKTKAGLRDISKSADPTNENGLEFREDGTFLSFGNPGHRDEGVYSLLEGGILILESSKNKHAVSKATVEIRGDSLDLSFQLNEDQPLNISLYKMPTQ